MWLLLSGFLSGVLLTGLTKALAGRLNMMDVPVGRSSHTAITPRGGGLSILVVAVAAGVFCLPLAQTWPLLIAALMVGCVGFYDDCCQASRRLRLVIQVAAALLVVLMLQPSALLLSGWELTGGLLWALLVLWYVWCTNLYNFMDGINGLAGLEAISVFLALAFLSDPVQSEWLGYFLLLSGVNIGFLIWNFPRARIFMGDTGSAFLGAFFAGLSVYFCTVNVALFWAVLIMLGVFVVDTTCTLLRRAWLRQSVLEAHRTHAYQYAAHGLGSHTKVSLSVVAINLFWLFPWALLVRSGWIPGWQGLLIAYAPLVVIALMLKAGLPEKGAFT